MVMKSFVGNKSNMEKSIQTPLGVYTDDEVGIEMIVSYATQRVIEELERIPHLETPLGEEIRLSSYYVYTRIKELKQD